MLVQDVMTKEVVTITSSESLQHADQLMIRGRFRHLPVVDNDRLVGIISDRDIRAPLFLLPTTDVVHTMSTIPVREIMSRSLITVPPRMAVEQAAAIMHENKIGCLPVVDNERLVGILTESDIFQVLVEVMGVLVPSSRLQLTLDDRPGPLADVTRIIKEHNVNIVSLVTEPTDETGKRSVVLRLQTIDPTPIIQSLQRAGLQVTLPKIV